MAGPPPLPDKLTPYPVIANIEFAEGPIFDDHGNLYFVNYMERGTLGRMSPDGMVAVWVHTGGVANGLKYDGRGNIVAADHGSKRVTRFNTLTRAMEVLTEIYEGHPYGGPNDVCLDLNGNIYFTDPGGSSPENPIGGIYRIDVDANNRLTGVKQIEESQVFPNGLAVHPDGKRFYFANSWLNQIVGYDLASDGNLSNRHVAVQLPNDTVDGIMFDEYDRLWVARWANGTVDVVNVDKGEVLASYPAGGTNVTNLCWWKTTLYVTVAGAHAIHRFDVGVRSARIVPGQ